MNIFGFKRMFKEKEKKYYFVILFLVLAIFYAGCNWITTLLIVPDNGGMGEYDSQFKKQEGKARRGQVLQCNKRYAILTP